MDKQERLENLNELLSSYYNSDDFFEQTDLAVSIIQGHVDWLIQQNKELFKQRNQFREALIHIRDNSSDGLAKFISKQVINKIMK
ncbi:hypothetical protein [Paraliobacillus ryukyuensis]|uniref:hypothetical protein n=1 Tax=Paraliobacillus ryukyuensis TaxID=200904 RepID=UPI0009A88C86|nr:hypothetical protein [Paraliobacillus ryukyuensis]